MPDTGWSDFISREHKSHKGRDLECFEQQTTNDDRKLSSTR